MITIEQCRAARGLLDWTQQDLADASGLSKTAINNFEKSHSDIKAESLRAIEMAFESADIEFLGEHGLRKRTEEAKIFKGVNALSDVQDDIFEALKDSGGEVLIISASGHPLPLAKSHHQRMKTHNITERIICAKGTIPGAASPAIYCQIPKNSFQGYRTSFVYGSKFAFEVGERDMFIIINSRDAAHAEKIQFEYLWDKIMSGENKKGTGKEV